MSNESYLIQGKCNEVYPFNGNSNIMYQKRLYMYIDAK